MIAAYQRISRADGDLGKDGKDKSNSIENQKELIQRYISCKESLQNVPVMDFVDDGYTGSNFDRPGFQQMMDGVRNGKIDTIIVKDLSRFGRDYIGVGEWRTISNRLYRHSGAERAWNWLGRPDAHLRYFRSVILKVPSFRL
jgi:site-specific DNA recombinase